MPAGLSSSGFDRFAARVEASSDHTSRRGPDAMRALARRKLLVSGALAATALLGVGCWYGWAAAHVAVGYSARVLCSAVFLSGRDADAVIAEDLATLPFVSNVVDHQRRTVTSSVGPISRRAVYREGLGSVLVIGRDEEGLRGQAPASAATGGAPALESVVTGTGGRPWPEGDGVGPTPAGVDRARLSAAIDAMFTEPDPESPRRTRAVVVVHGGRIVGERYAPGFDATTPQLGWSMTKSVINALVGVLVQQGRLAIDAPAGFEAWGGDGDPRAAITTDQLLRMSSGLVFSEQYFVPTADAVTMLFRSGDTAGYAAERPAEHVPDAHWSYSSGTSNLLSAVLRRAFDGDTAAYHAFPRRALFDPIGMRSGVMETDAAGTFIGSSFCYATARDWARFGLLYLRDGVWEGRRILPEGWVEYTARPTPKAPRGVYGAHFWLNAGDPGDPADRRFPSLPRDIFWASGFQGQVVVVSPSHDAVVVRLGLSAGRAWGLEGFLQEVLAALADTSAE
jgi:CubicO group peptidase (beta-lactamase class C family)